MQSAVNLVDTIRNQAVREAEHHNIKKQVADAAYQASASAKRGDRAAVTAVRPSPTR
jgi:hypothetical protein